MNQNVKECRCVIHKMSGNAEAKTKELFTS